MMRDLAAFYSQADAKFVEDARTLTLVLVSQKTSLLGYVCTVNLMSMVGSVLIEVASLPCNVLLLSFVHLTLFLL